MRVSGEHCYSSIAAAAVASVGVGVVGCSFAGRSVIADAMAAVERATAASHCYCMHWPARLAASTDIAGAIISSRTSIVKVAMPVAAAKYPGMAVGRRLQHRG